MQAPAGHAGQALGFRLLVPADLRLLHEWFQRPHVKRWWLDGPETYEQVVDEYLPAIDGRSPDDLYLALLDERPIGFIQTYLMSDYPEWAKLVGGVDGAAGVDLFIAEADLTGQGIGTAMLRRFVAEIVFARPATIACVADPDVRNTASVRAFEKAGFRIVAEFLDPSDGQMHALVRLERGA